MQALLQALMHSTTSMKNKPRLYSILLLGLVFLLASSTIGCGHSRYIYENDAVIVGGDDKPIELINNPDTTNPTYAELVAFLEKDETDQHLYVPHSTYRGNIKMFMPYVCADFAEEVHNNAEEAGIRAGFVSVSFEDGDEGHALNVFETSDKGLVFVDCTGLDFKQQSAIFDDYVKGYLPHSALSCDTVAYIAVGEEYGRIDLDEAGGTSYEYYEWYRGRGLCEWESLGMVIHYRMWWGGGEERGL